MVQPAPRTWRNLSAGTLALLGLLASLGPARAQREAPNVLQDLEEALARVAQRVLPAVVQVRVERERPQPGGTPQEREQPEEPPQIPEDFRRFFQQPFPFQPPSPEDAPIQGSGIIFRPDGYILTNAHVVRNARDIQVKFVQQRRTRPATLIGLDDRMDIAVIKVEANGADLPTLPFGDSDAARIGQLVLAVGSPFEFEATMTLGILSAQERSIDDPGGRNFRYRHLLQTDAAINPGNSGGPLVNIWGEVIGVNNAIYGARGNIGIGFAIPINEIKSKLDLLIEKGAIPRGYLGVSVREESEEALRELYGVDSGAWVHEVQPNTPAEEVGIQSGDLIIEFDGEAVHGPDDLVDLVSNTPPQRDIVVKFLRRVADGGATESRELTLQLAPLPAELGGVREMPLPRAARRDQLGLVVVPLPEELKAMEGAPNQGVLVQEVVPNSPAAEAGMTPGLIVVRVGHRQGDQVVRNRADYDRCLQALEGARALTVQTWARIDGRWTKRSYILQLSKEE